MADLASESDEIEMGGVIIFGVDGRFHEVMRFFKRQVRFANTQAAADTVDVRVHREGGASERELQNNGSRLAPNSFETQQPLAGFFEGQGFEKFKVQFSAFFRDLAQNLLNTRAFLVCQSGDANGCDHLIHWSISNFFPGGEFCGQRVERQIAIAVVGVL